MGKILGPDGLSFHKSETDEERLIASFYCGQIMALHHLVHFFWRGKGKYRVEDIFRFIHTRYNYLAKEYPNFHNQIVKNDRELTSSGETDATYHNLFKAMLRQSKEIDYQGPNI